MLILIFKKNSMHIDHQGNSASTQGQKRHLRVSKKAVIVHGWCFGENIRRDILTPSGEEKSSTSVPCAEAGG